jgi:hypothetical protein
MPEARKAQLAHRWTVGSAAAGFAAVMTILSSPAMASGAPCDGASCVQHVRSGAVAGAECSAKRLYAFGIGAGGATMICYATYRNPITSVWLPVPPLLGERDVGALCEEDGVAQSPDGLPLVCRDSIWERYTPAVPLS